MLKKPTMMNAKPKKISMILAGVPGIGKTTMACSAPRPLVIDLDEGMDRVEGQYRKDILSVSSYEEMVNDLTTNDLSEYDTIVVDTGGKLLELLKPVVIAEDNKNGKRNGELTLAGYGAVKRKFREAHSMLKKLDKHIVYIFHASEVQLANDVTGLRIRMEGSSKDEVWDDMDLGCFMEMVGQKRTLGFSNCERYYAKGTHGIKGIYEVPTLASGTKNNFLTMLFNQYNETIKQETLDIIEYNKVMDAIRPKIENAKTLEEINETYKEISTAKHSLTSKEELWFAIKTKAKELGGEYDKQTNLFNNSKPTK